jgi:hypothetical protein
VHALARGADFDSTVAVFRQACYYQAGKRDCGIETHRTGPGTLDIRFILAERRHEAAGRRGYRPGGRAAYPWEQWADRSVHRLTAGTDFDGSGHRFRQFRQACYAAAERLDCRVVTRVTGPATVDIQFISG